MILPCGDLNLEATLESGQVFGFTRNAQGRYEGSLKGHPVQLWRTATHLNVQNGTGPLSEDHVRDYFDLEHDLKETYRILRSDPALAASLKTFKGLRLIRQDPWEALACFIISSNNNVKRIMGIHKNMVTHFGGFPSAAQIAAVHERTLRQLGLGYRAPFLSRTATFLSHNPGYLKTIRDLDYEQAKERVLSFPGIGPKVADCALLYGFHKLEAFPVDVWIARIVRMLYFRNRSIPEDKVRRFGMKRWGMNAGYVQQYLFHGARSGIFAAPSL